MKTCIFNQKNLFPVYPVRIGINHLQETVHRPVGLCFNQIFYICDGCGYLKTDKCNYTLNKGDMFFIKKNIPHSYGGEENFTTSYLGYDGEFCENLHQFFGEKEYAVYKNKNAAEFLSELENFYREFDSIKSSAVLSSRAYSLISLFFDSAKKESISPTEKVKDYLNSHYFLPLTLEDISKVFPYSKSKLCRDFRKDYGCSIFEMLTRIRLEHARIMLADPCRKCSDTAKACGFNDTSYFCRIYREYYGTSPKKSGNR